MLKPLLNIRTALSRNSYVNALKTIKSFKGIYRNIIMNDDNCNEKLQLLKYEYGQFIPLN